MIIVNAFVLGVALEAKGNSRIDEEQIDDGANDGLIHNEGISDNDRQKEGSRWKSTVKRQRRQRRQRTTGN